VSLRFACHPRLLRSSPVDRAACTPPTISGRRALMAAAWPKFLSLSTTWTGPVPSLTRDALGLLESRVIYLLYARPPAAASRSWWVSARGPAPRQEE